MATNNHTVVDVGQENGNRDIDDQVAVTPFDIGLTTPQVTGAQKKYGKNVLEEKVETIWKKIGKSLVSPISLLIEVAIIVTIIINDLLDVFILAFLLILNTSVHIIHEWKAEGIVNQLKNTLALHAHVRRDGEEIQVLAQELVPGDIIMIETGDVIPADARVIGDEAYLLVDQSTMTGESLAVEKIGGDPLYSTTTVKRGREWAQVTHTGKNTNVGKTAELVSFTKVSDKYSRVLASINNLIMVSDFFICFLIFIIALFRGIALVTVLVFIIILTVASLPIALPAVLTVTMAVGARTLAEKQAIVTRLASIEALASVNILCTDKTGTLTMNKLSIHPPYIFRTSYLEEDTLSITAEPGFQRDGSEQSSHDRQRRSLQSITDADLDDSGDGGNLSYIKDLILTAALASEHHDDRSKLDPIDQAILLAFDTYHIPQEDLDTFETIHFVPFDPVSKRVEAHVKNTLTGEEWTVTKGAPQVILGLLGLDDDQPMVKKYNAVTLAFAKRGFRSLGVAKRSGTHGEWNVLGIIPLFDPPRPDSAHTLNEAKKLGLQIKMLTGDALAIAKETAKRLGMGQNIYDASHLSLDETILPNTTESEQIEQADGFSQIFPEHKYNVVDALQRRGHIVAVSGDGQNDAAALKKANVGIAVSGAVDSARAASSIVFLKEGLSVMVDAIRLSRQIFVRMYGYAIYRIAHSLHLLWFVLFLFSIFSYLFPIELLIILAIFSDLSVLLIGFDNAASSPEPESWDLKHVFIISLVLSIVLFIGTLVWFILLTFIGLPASVVTTLLFLQVALTENQLIFSTRLRSSAIGKPWPSIWLFATVLIVDAIATVFVALGIIVPAAVGYIWIIQTWIYSLGVFMILDMTKVATRGLLMTLKHKQKQL